MTQAVVTSALTEAAVSELRGRFGWEITALPRGAALLDGGPFDPAEVEAVVIEAERLDAATLDAFPKLSLIACLRGNPVNVDVKHAAARAIPVVHTPGRNAESVADLVFGLIYSCVRHISHAHHLIVSRQLTEDRETDRVRKDVIWRPSDPARPVPYNVFKGPELSRLVLGVIGFGAIGRRVAGKASALGMGVLAHDPFLDDAVLAAAGAEPVDLESLLRRADVVSLHAPGQDGPPLIGARELALMQPSAYLINTARASVLDYDALLDALRDGRIAGAGLDVFPDEPLSSDSQLLDLPNVTLTPHIAGASTNVVEHQSELLLQSLRALAEGRVAAALIKDPAVLERVPDGVPAALRDGVGKTAIRDPHI